jgi:hypothetical protein
MSLDLKKLACELDDLRDRRDDEEQSDPLDDEEQSDPLDDDDRERLKTIEDLEGEIGDLHLAHRDKGSFLADGREWVEYAEELAYDIGMCDRESALARYVDWDRWAEDLKADYQSVDFDGETYYYEDH